VAGVCTGNKAVAPSFDRQLHRDPDCYTDVGIPAVEHVIAVVDVAHVNNVGVVPVIRPVLRPWVNSAKPIALVLEAWIPANDQERQPVNAEAVVRAKISSIAVVRNAIAVVPASLLPIAVVRLPALCAVLLPGRLFDVLLLLRALGLFIASVLLRLLVLSLPLLLLGMLLLLVLIGLLLLGMLLLFVLIRLLLLLLSVLLWSRLFGFALLLLGMVLLFILLLVLCVHRSRDSKKQGQNSGARNLHNFHSYCLQILACERSHLAQSSSRRVDGVAYGFARHEKFHSPVLLSAGGVLVGGHRQSVAEAL
jgi:hypothetical protein